MTRHTSLLSLLVLIVLGGAVVLRAQETETPDANQPTASDDAQQNTQSASNTPASNAATSGNHTRAVVTLVGGAQVTGAVLRNNDNGVVVDLGDDILNLSRNRILNVRKLDSTRPDTAATDQGVYRTGRLESAPVQELVRRFGDAVVTIRTAAGMGSGFFISEQGHLITNYHVIENETRISVTVYHKTEEGHEKKQITDVEILALQPLRDIALLKVNLDEAEGFSPQPVVIAREPDVEVGDLVFTIGNPLGLERSVTQGIVSSTTRTLEHLRLFQTDASINPGNSGGPLFNARGEVVGIVCAGMTFSDGLAFGIPASDLLDFLRNREAYLYDPSQPQNGIRYLDPPFHTPKDAQDKPDGSSPGKPEENSNTDSIANTPSNGE